MLPRHTGNVSNSPAMIRRRSSQRLRPATATQGRVAEFVSAAKLQARRCTRISRRHSINHAPCLFTVTAKPMPQSSRAVDVSGPQTLDGKQVSGEDSFLPKSLSSPAVRDNIVNLHYVNAAGPGSSRQMEVVGLNMKPTCKWLKVRRTSLS